MYRGNIEALAVGLVTLMAHGATEIDWGEAAPGVCVKGATVEPNTSAFQRLSELGWQAPSDDGSMGFWFYCD